jgi:adenylate cyclase
MIVTGIGAASLYAPALPFIESAEGYLRDVQVAALSERGEGQEHRISVVTITEETLASLPFRSPISRRFLAELLVALNNAGARAIAFDILFDQATEPAQDDALKYAIKNSTPPVVVATLLDRTNLTEDQRLFHDLFVQESGALTGFANLLVDADGVVRSHPDTLSTTERSLASAILNGAGLDVPRAKNLIAWRRSPSEAEPALQSLPAHLVLRMNQIRPELVRKWVQDRFVLVGADLPIEDRFRTPLNVDPSEPEETPGVVIHAQALIHLLDGERMRQATWDEHLLVLVLLGILAVGLAFFHAAALIRFGLALMILVGFWVAAAFIFRTTQVLLPVLTPSVHLFLIYGLTSAVHGHAAAQQQRVIRSAFSQYLAPFLVDRLAKDPTRLVLGGERRELSFIFSDIAGFTTLSERLAPDALVRLLNEYLDGMSEIVLNHGGTIDKFIGDAVVAFFGAPTEQPDHAQRAIRCAVEMDVFAEKFRRGHTPEDFGGTRIGVNSGPATVGNFGGRARFDYTAMGDTVNTAARLESLNKHLGTRVCISGSTISAARASVEELPTLRKVGSIVLKGKTEAIQAFEPIPVGDKRLECLERYRAALAKLEAGAPDAREAFANLVEANPSDGLVAFHLNRIDKGETGTTMVMLEK